MLFSFNPVDFSLVTLYRPYLALKYCKSSLKDNQIFLYFINNLMLNLVIYVYPRPLSAPAPAPASAPATSTRDI